MGDIRESGQGSPLGSFSAGFDKYLRSEQYLGLPPHVLDNLHTFGPKFARSVGNALVDALHNPVVQQISEAVDKAMVGPSDLFNQLSEGLGRTIGKSTPFKPILVTEDGSPAIFEQEADDLARAAMVSRAILDSTMSAGIQFFKIDDISWNAFRRVAAIALKKPPGEALKDIYTHASPAKKAGILVGGIATGGGLLALACNGLVQASQRLNTPTVPPSPDKPTVGPTGTPSLVACDSKAILPANMPAIGGPGSPTLETLKSQFSNLQMTADREAKTLGVSVLVTDTLEYAGPKGFQAIGMVTCSPKHDLDGRLAFIRSDAQPGQRGLVILPPSSQYPKGTIPDLQDGKLVFAEPNTVGNNGQTFALGELNSDTGEVIEYPWIEATATKGINVRTDHTVKGDRITGMSQNDLAIVKDVYREDGVVWLQVVLPNGTLGWISQNDLDGSPLVKLSNPAKDTIAKAKITTPTPTVTISPSPTPKPTEAPKPTETLRPLKFQQIFQPNTDELPWGTNEWVGWNSKSLLGGKIEVIDDPAGIYGKVTKHTIVDNTVTEGGQQLNRAYMSFYGKELPLPCVIKIPVYLSADYVPGRGGWINFGGIFYSNPKIGGDFRVAGNVDMYSDRTPMLKAKIYGGNDSYYYGKRVRINPGEWHTIGLGLDEKGQLSYYLDNFNDPVASGSMDPNAPKRIVGFHAGAYGQGIPVGSYILNGPITVECR